MFNVFTIQDLNASWKVTDDSSWLIYAPEIIKRSQRYKKILKSKKNLIPEIDYFV